MLLIRKLIEDKMREGKSMSRIAEESGVSKTAIHNYYHSKAKPEGKSLALLSKYFNTEVECLLDEIGGGPSVAAHFGVGLEDRLAHEEWRTLSRDEKLLAVQMLRKLKADAKKA